MKFARSPLVLIPAFAAFLSLLLVIPGRTYVGRFVLDLIGFMDAADRTLKGQVANVDYSNIIGPLGTLLLAAGKWLGGSWGAMFPIATVIVLAAVTPLLIYVVCTRLGGVPGLIFAAFILIIIAAPITLGDIPRMMTFAMFYNRWGWAILSILFVMALPGGSKWDSVAIAFSLAALFYIKVTFAAAGLAFVLGCMVLLPHMRQRAILALAGLLAILLLVELFWGGTRGYLADLANAAAQSGIIRGGLRTFVGNAVNNATDFLLLGVVVVLAAYRGVRPVYFLFAVGMAVGGLLLFGQSAQLGSIVTVVPAAVLLMFAPSDRPTEKAEKLVFAALAASLAVTPAVALTWHTIAASSPVADPRSQIDGIITPGGNSEIPFALERMERAYAERKLGVTELSSVAVIGFPEGDRFYFWSIHDGVALLKRAAPKGSILTLDMTNPFNALLGRDPPEGVDVFQAYGRTIGESTQPRSAAFFRDSDIVMVPAFPRNAQSGALMRRIHAPYLREHFQVAARSRFWMVLTRKRGMAEHQDRLQG